MKQINLKYGGTCRKCDAPLDAGQVAEYEKSMGIFCIPCAPRDTEEIREFRQMRADAKAERYEQWAANRRSKAEALHARNTPFTRCHAFNTQPGHIPERARVIKREQKAFEHSRTAARFEAKAQGLRVVRVAGDAERKRQAIRDAVKASLSIGATVDTCFFGRGTVAKINQKTATIEGCGTSGTYKTNVDLSFIRVPETVAP